MAVAPPKKNPGCLAVILTPDSIEEAVVTPYDPLKTPPHVFLGAWEGEENELVLGEGQALRLVPLALLPERMPPHIRHYILQLTAVNSV
ncbi:hypothetical protein [Streptomyces violaceusniger]|uniref:Uncharacterized protein n=1 Tax=Streptomyces violaceusniger TaxID=68280 RepID=A0A4D4L911_STRVO|nr:hypothetical protein SVIO_061430 [Streptomyces violaceusniger]